jgi:hypothetical protein
MNATLRQIGGCPGEMRNLGRGAKVMNTMRRLNVTGEAENCRNA